MTVFNLNETQSFFVLLGAAIVLFVLGTLYVRMYNKLMAKKVLNKGVDLTKLKPDKLHYVMDEALVSKVLRPGVARQVWLAFQTERRNEGLPVIYRDISTLRLLVEREGDISFFTTEDIDMLIVLEKWEFLKLLDKSGYTFDEAQRKTLDSFFTYTPAELLKHNRARLATAA